MMFLQRMFVRIVLVLTFVSVAEFSSPCCASEEASETISPEECRLVTKRLKSNLDQIRELQSVQLLLTLIESDGTARVLGFLEDSEQRAKIEELGLRALEREAERGTVPRRITRINASQMSVVRMASISPTRFVIELEKQLAYVPGCLVRVRAYRSAEQRIALCGTVDGPSHRELLEDVLPVLDGIEQNQVDTTSLIVVDYPKTAFVDGSHYAHAAIHARRGEETVEVATLMIRQGSSKADVWYLRAVGHLLQGKRDDAMGDVRIAVAIEGSRAIYGGLRPHLLQRFQGTTRLELERMVVLGPTLTVTDD